MPMIEVDIVARRGAVIAVVEVKYRQTLDTALAALKPSAAERLRAAAAQIAAEAAARQAVPHSRRGAGAQPAPSARVDLIALAPWTLPRHIAGVA